MRVFAVVLLACCAIFTGCGVNETVAEIQGTPPSRVYASPETPAATLSALTALSDEDPGRVEYVDQAAGVVVVSANHFLTGDRGWIMVTKADVDRGATRVQFWTRGIGYHFGPSETWADRLWSRYQDDLKRRGIADPSAGHEPLANRQP